MRKLLITTGILALLAVPFWAAGQSSSLWKFVGNLRPVVSTWRADFPGGISGSTIGYFGLTDCDGDGQTLAWDFSTQRFGCGDDDSGGSLNTGAILDAGNDRFVNVSGDTMTGALTIDLSSGTVGLEVVQTASAAILHANTLLRSSGSLVTESGAYFDGSTFVVQAGSDQVGIGTASPTADLHILDDDSRTEIILDNTASNGDPVVNFRLPGTAQWVVGLDDSDSDSFKISAGSALGSSDRVTVTQAGLVGIATTSPDSALEVIGTVSGSNVYTVGSVSGTHLYAATTFGGAGLADCDTAGTSKLLWDAATKQFSCGTDTDMTFTAGEGLSLNGTAFSRNAAITGSSLIIRGSMSGQSLTVSTLKDCDTIDTDGNGVLSCGTDDVGSSGLTFSQAEGIYVNQKGDTMTGGLVINLTSGTLALDVKQIASGAIIHASSQLRSSGSLAVEGAAVIGGNLTAGDLICSSAGCIDATALGTDSVSADELNASGVESELEAVLDHDDLQGFVANEHIDHTSVNISAGQGLTGGGDLSATRVLSLSAAHSGTIIRATTSLNSSGSLTWEGAGSGDSLWVSTFDGAGLVDCDADNQSLSWDTTSKRFVCGDDDSTGSGLDQAAADERYVNQSGDTMTGALVINVTGGVQATQGLRIIQSASGAHLHAEKTLSSSGGLVVEGTATVGDLSCTDCLDFAELEDTLNPDAATTIVLGANQLTINLDSSGDFVVQDNGNTALIVEDDGSIGMGPGGFYEHLFHMNLSDVGSGSDSRSIFVMEKNDDVIMTLRPGTTNTGAIFFGGGEGQIKYSVSTNGLEIMTNNAVAMFIDSSQEVGIGTRDPTTKLEVVGTVSGTTVLGNKRSIMWYVSGTLTTGTEKAATFRLDQGMRCTDVTMHVKTAPTSAALIVDINEGGVSMFSTRPEIDASGTTEDNNHAFSDRVLDSGDEITMDIDQIGSGTAGADLTVILECYAST